VLASDRLKDARILAAHQLEQTSWGEAVEGMTAGMALLGW